MNQVSHRDRDKWHPRRCRPRRILDRLRAASVFCITAQCLAQSTLHITFDGNPFQPPETSFFVQQYYEADITRPEPAHKKRTRYSACAQAATAGVVEELLGIATTFLLSRCGARSIWLALSQARSFSGWRPYLLRMMASSSMTWALARPSSWPINAVFPTPP